MAGYQTTATDLTNDLQAWMEDDAAEFTASIPQIIGLAEERLVKDLDLSIFYATTTAATTASDENLAKPAAYLADERGVKSIYYEVSGERTFLELRSYDWINDYLSSVDGPPLYYAEPDQTNLILAPRPDQIYTMTIRYTKRPDRLVVSTNETNWLSNFAGDYLFKACLAEAEKFLKSDDRIQIWEQDYTNLLGSSKRELYELMATRYPELRAFPLGAGQ